MIFANVPCFWPKLSVRTVGHNCSTLQNLTSANLPTIRIFSILMQIVFQVGVEGEVLILNAVKIMLTKVHSISITWTQSSAVQTVKLRSSVICVKFVLLIHRKTYFSKDSNFFCLINDRPFRNYSKFLLNTKINRVLW